MFFVEIMMRIYNITENQVVVATANYLKWAPERKDGGGRKKYSINDRTCIFLGIFSDEIFIKFLNHNYE